MQGKHAPCFAAAHHATLALLEGCVDTDALSKQMGNIAAMLKWHKSMLTATMATDKLLKSYKIDIICQFIDM